MAWAGGPRIFDVTQMLPNLRNFSTLLLFKFGNMFIRYPGMRVFFRLRILALMALGLLAGGAQVGAQGVGFSVIPSTNLVVLGSSLTYTINLTNRNAFGGFRVFVTNTFLNSAELRGAGFTVYTGTVFTNANGYSFDLLFNNGGDRAQMFVQVKPNGTGLFTNAVDIVATTGDSFSGNSIVLVTNAAIVPTNFTDLAVGVAGPTSTVFSNDWMRYTVSVTNLGPGNATNVLLTNSLPPGVGYKSVSPSMNRIGAGSNVTFNLGKLLGGAFTNLVLTVQPTNAGAYTFVSTISTNNVNDTNAANNSASFELGVSNFLSAPGQLTATIVSTQNFSQLSGRLEQNIMLSNAGPTAVTAARVIVTGLTNRLWNAADTNNGNPYVTYGATLAAGESAFLLLQFYPTQTAFPFTNSQMEAVGVSPPNWALATSGLVPTNIQLFLQLPSGARLIMFPSLTNRTYTVAYSSNLVSDWLVAQPLTWTPANYTYWIDYGPPATISHPTNTPVRFYRVFLNP